MIKRQDHKRRSLHHKEVGYPSAPNQVVGGARTRDIIGGWWQLFKGGFDEHSTQRRRVKNIDLILSLVREVEKEDEEEEGVDMRKK